MRIGDSDTIRTTGLSFLLRLPIFNTVIIRIILRISGSVIVKTVINGSRRRFVVKWGDIYAPEVCSCDHEKKFIESRSTAAIVFWLKVRQARKIKR